MRGRASPFARALPRRKSVFFENIGERIRAFTPVPFRRMRRRLWGMRYRTRVSVPKYRMQRFVRRVCRNGRGEGTKAYRGRNAARCGGFLFARRHEATPFGAWRMEWANLLEKQAPAAFIPVPGRGKTP